MTNSLTETGKYKLYVKFKLIIFIFRIIIPVFTHASNWQNLFCNYFSVFNSSVFPRSSLQVKYRFLLSLCSTFENYPCANGGIAESVSNGCPLTGCKTKFFRTSDRPALSRLLVVERIPLQSPICRGTARVPGDVVQKDIRLHWRGRIVDRSFPRSNIIFSPLFERLWAGDTVTLVRDTSLDLAFVIARARKCIPRLRYAVLRWE